MTYTANVPTANQSLGSSRPIINENFQRISTVFANNHVAFNASGEGKHKFLQMPAQGSAPSTAAAEGGLYTKDIGTGITQLFYRRESNGTEIRVTGGNSNVAAGGYTYLANGLLFQWGNATPTGSNTTITFPVTFTAVFQAVASFSSSTQGYGVTNLANNQFIFAKSDSSAAGTIRWMAIGTTTSTI